MDDTLVITINLYEVAVVIALFVVMASAMMIFNCDPAQGGRLKTPDGRLKTRRRSTQK